MKTVTYNLIKRATGPYRDKENIPRRVRSLLESLVKDADAQGLDSRYIPLAMVGVEMRQEQYFQLELPVVRNMPRRSVVEIK